MKILHIFSGEDGKFSIEFSKFIFKNFDSSHQIVVFNKKVVHENIIILRKNLIGLITIIQKMYNAEKIFIHSLSISVTVILFFNPWLLKKSYWVIWGGDIYNHQSNKQKSKIKFTIKKLMKCFTIKRFKGLITYIDGTYDLAVKSYGAKGKYYKCIMYPSNTYKEFPITEQKRERNKINILVGSSSLPRNNHIYLFEKIKQYVNEDYKAICPLSYGDFNYRDEVIKQGKELLGNHFEPINDFMEYEEYIKLLSEVDIAIYGHEKNQAMGNIITLLGLGKKVYMKDDLTSWETLEGLGIKLYAINKEPINSEFPHKIREQNIKIVREYFSNETLILQWKEIFNS